MLSSIRFVIYRIPVSFSDKHFLSDEVVVGFRRRKRGYEGRECETRVHCVGSRESRGMRISCCLENVLPIHVRYCYRQRDLSGGGGRKEADFTLRANDWKR